MSPRIDATTDTHVWSERSARPFRFAFDYYSSAGAPLGRRACDLEAGGHWEPAREWLRHLALRRDLPQDETAAAPVQLSPVWDDRGEPYCRAVCVALVSRGERIACELGTDYFRAAAEETASALVSEGRLGRSEQFRFDLCAYALPETLAAAPSATDGLRIESAPTPIAIGSSALRPRLAAARPHGEHDAADIPVFVPSRVLEEVTDLARAAGRLESGGVLAGRLVRCPERRELFVEVSALIPARHGEAGTGRFTFTPETWADVDRTLTLRRRAEVPVGWAHSHPRFCASCPPERQRDCLFSKPFFSEDDRHLHRAVFPLGHQVGLLISDLPERGHVPALYGWRHARVVERGFHELPARAR
jgi:hypothetical protein